ncbi:hypothetical protein SPRG_20818 [Saprolegnia parasitica CBS 223.65]|uniref:Succinate dehydrogenase assembly factor 2 n=1 Tax=Saprolegnia parasitica (strain CBS 223.65) TaxID=695850 RepID=A0A067CE16_SAPPC|nr:hypothetical protein SPRG_20818 [Saprolegnia parasitica CBS 223.65]KDO24781.1 hypothetical protein SPRG_20818 [Saprolegnia parasitica CBS 223.65]|eukprot:XP_012204520.1 hypothetical protein SPRG_20818 [Saprolegnia parasitica CBS 223.65]
MLARASILYARAAPRMAARAFSTEHSSFHANLPPLSITEAQELRAQVRNEQMRKDHFAIKAEYPDASQGEEAIDADKANRKRVIYRSKQRGWLEVDLLLGRWASENVMSLTADELRQYEDILNRETIDIFNFISGKDAVPPEIDTPMMKRLQAYCKTSPLGKASIQGFLDNKKYMSN